MSIRFCYALAAVLAIAGLARAEDALDAANAARAARGLPPFIRCPQLTAGAINVAQFRAERLIKGHCSNDFAGLPVGVTADAAGCAGNSPSFGFMACCLFENWREAGAAMVLGRDGALYCQLFVRGSSQPKGVSYASQNPVSSRSRVSGRRR